MFVYRNAYFYDNKYSKKSYRFWQNILNIKEFKKIFYQYKADTLKKYSNRMHKMDYDSQKILLLIKRNEDILNSNDKIG